MSTFSIGGGATFRRMMRSCAIIGIAALLGSSVGATEADQTLGKFDWMVGCWESVDGKEREVWSPSEGGIHFGYSVTVKGKSNGAQFFEHLRLELRDKAHFIAYPNGMAPTIFKEAASDLISATFVNPEHDYPQRIRYARQQDTMIASISKIDGTEQRIFERRLCKDREESK